MPADIVHRGLTRIFSYCPLVLWINRSAGLKKYRVNELEIYIDGASQGNPGPAGIGIVITENGQVIHNISEPLGIQTNNYAEYMALIFGLQEAMKLGAAAIKVYTDSQLMCQQLNNKYKIKSPNLITLYRQAKHLLSAFKQVQIKFIPREKNRGADKLAKKATKKLLDTGQGGCSIPTCREESPNS